MRGWTDVGDRSLALAFPTIVVNVHRSLDVVELAKQQGRLVMVDRSSIWGNPFSHKMGTLAKYRVGTREEAIARYDEWLSAQPQLLAQLPTLRGKVLGCHCLPMRCHALCIARRVHALA